MRELTRMGSATKQPVVKLATSHVSMGRAISTAMIQQRSAAPVTPVLMTCAVVLVRSLVNMVRCCSLHTN